MAKENMTVAQLKEVAQQKGIIIPSKATKVQIIELLEAKPSKEKKVKSEAPKKEVKKFSGEY